MRTTIVLLFMGLQVAACGEEPAPTALAALRFDGVYRCRPAEERDDPVWLFLRFYADRLVVAGAADAEPWRVEHWLDRSWDMQGQYVVSGGRVTCTCTAPGIATDYEGRLLPDGLSVTWVSKATGDSGSAEFQFVPFTSDMEAPWGGPVPPDQLLALRALGIPLEQGGLVYEYQGNPAQGGLQRAEIGLTPKGRATVESMYDSGFGNLQRRFVGRWRVDGGLLLLEVEPHGGGDPVTLVAVVRDTLLLFNDEWVEGYDLLEGDSRLQQALPADGDSDTVALRLKKPVPKPVERER